MISKANLRRHLIHIITLAIVGLTSFWFGRVTDIEFFPGLTLDEAFLMAAATGHTVRAEVLLLRGANVNARTQDDSGNTALHFAAKDGNITLIRLLLWHGADINALAVFHYTPLAEAKGAGQSEAERILLSYGAKPIPPYPGRP